MLTKKDTESLEKMNFDLASTVTFATKSVNEKYKKKSHRDHILEIPDTYVGSIESVTETMWVFNEETNLMERQDITYIPALFKIFDEVLVNANDAKIRYPDVKNIKVSIDEESGKISVWNDGAGIDVEIHEDTKVYAPELIFGHLLTSTNYDQSEKKLTGGKNGYGAKLTNIFSTWFHIETVDNAREKKYSQEFCKNMTEVGKPKITSSKGKPYVLVEFIPDFKRFRLENLTSDIVKMFKKRVYDLSATVKDVNIFLNDKKLPIRNFEKYIELYIGSNKKEVPRVYELVNDRWEIGACTSPTGTFQQISFVNGIWTYKGGKHVDYIAGQLSRKVSKYINEKKKKLDVKECYVKENLSVFIRCLIENPSFSSQTKEELTTISTKFGSKCEVSDEFIEKLAKSGVMDKAVELTAFKEKDSLKKTDGKKRLSLADIPKLDDANKAGSSDSHKCTLILTEGDSAKASAISGLSVVGRDHFGVFPLKGKLLNVREATNSQLLNNEEIKQIKKILGLQHYEKGSTKSKEYSDIKELRYGKVLIMTDADVDGSHIKGLLINFFHFHWPSLLKIPNFIDTLKTPLVKVHKGSKKLIFYSLSEYENWKKTTLNSNTWETKYYKGLGTSTSEEFKEYFREMTKNLVHYTWKDDTQENDSITLAFQKERSDDRKKWLNEYNADPHHETREIVTTTPSYSDFIHRELIHFSNYDNIRSIPHMCDGLKPSQRKTLFACFKRNLKKEMKVAQLSGYVSEQTCYHHGEVSLQKTIIGMAQNFLGSNNVNLLVPNGQFGTRIKGGDDAASPRYIFTHLSPISFALFHEDDSPLLEHFMDDGTKIEPKMYLPILPTVLMNGTNGIGTGFRSKIPCYNPLDILQQIQKKLNILNSEEVEDLQGNKISVEDLQGNKISVEDLQGNKISVEDLQGNKISVEDLQGNKISVEDLQGNKISVEDLQGNKISVEDFQWEPIHPWYNKFDGTIELIENNSLLSEGDSESVVSSESDDYRKYICKGKYKILGDSIQITELPVDVWTQDYKEFIENAMLEHSETQEPKTKKSKKDDESTDSKTTASRKEKKIKKKYNVPILDYDNHCTEDKVNFTIKLEKGFIKTLKEEEILKRFKLTKIISTSSMYLYNYKGEIEHYKTPEEIMETFYGTRLEYYEKRKNYLLKKLLRECIVLENKVKFIQYVLEDKIKWNLPEEEIVQILDSLGLNRLDTDDFELGIDFTTRKAKPEFVDKVSYHYLLEMKIRSLTKEKVQSLQKEYDEKHREYELLEKKKISQMWLDDLKEFEKLYQAYSNEMIVKSIDEIVPAKSKKMLIKKEVPKVESENEDEKQEAKPKKKLLIVKKRITEMF